MPCRSRAKRIYPPRDHDTGNPRRSFRLRPGSALERALGDRPISDALHYMAARLEALGEKVPQL